LALPEAYAQPTELLDLKPLSTKIFKNEEFEKLYNFKTLNSIQTQVFSTLYNSDENFFLAGPNNSGISTCGEFAILRYFSNNENTKGKIVYITCNEQLSNSKHKSLEQKFSKVEKVVSKLTGEVNKDLKIIFSSDIIISTPEQWDLLSRRWKVRKQVQDVELFIIDDMQFIGYDKNGSILEIIVSRMRYISTQLENHKLRIIGIYNK
jgi:pre-mRNA-splicing helicase BRR2